MNPDLKIKIKNSQSLSKLILSVGVLGVALGAGFFSIIFSQSPSSAVVGFPNTGGSSTTEIPWLFLFIILIVFLTVIVLRNIKRARGIDHAKTEFVSLASHQLRTPLTTIKWYTEMILNGDVGLVIPEQEKYLKEIYDGNQRMIELVDTFLDVSRIELGTLRVELKPTDIIALAESVLSEQKPKIEQKKLLIRKDFNKNIPISPTDPRLLRMIFQNLLSNAVAYTPEGGKIEFTISLEGDQTILIKISDTGCGIPKIQQKHIFSKLFRADNVRNKGINGTGLGLYIVKSIIENFGGEIWFESEEGKGAIFYVTLPILLE